MLEPKGISPLGSSSLSAVPRLVSEARRSPVGRIGAPFGREIDHAALIKVYGQDPGLKRAEARYSPPVVVDTFTRVGLGKPDMAKVSTSHVERQNLSIRMGMRRMTRLTNGHSKKWENHDAAFALWFAYYNFCRVHMTLKTTPAVEAGLTVEPWTVAELLERIQSN